MQILQTHLPYCISNHTPALLSSASQKGILSVQKGARVMQLNAVHSIPTPCVCCEHSKISISGCRKCGSCTRLLTGKHKAGGILTRFSSKYDFAVFYSQELCAPCPYFFSVEDRVVQYSDHLCQFYLPVSTWLSSTLQLFMSK